MIHTPMRSNCITLLSIGLAFHAGEVVANPDPSASGEAKPAAEKPIAEGKREVLAIKVIVEQDGKVLGSYTAFGSADDRYGTLTYYCTGAVAFHDTALWRVEVQADFGGRKDSDMSVRVEDLKLFGKGKDEHIYPQEIFATTLQSKGLGNYLVGELQGVTLRVEFSRTEQKAEAQPAARPETK